MSKLAASSFKTTLPLLLEDELPEEDELLLDEELLELLEDELPEEDELLLDELELEDDELDDEDELEELEEELLLDVLVGAKTQPAVLDSPVAWT